MEKLAKKKKKRTATDRQNHQSDIGNEYNKSELVKWKHAFTKTTENSMLWNDNKYNFKCSVSVDHCKGGNIKQGAYTILYSILLMISRNSVIWWSFCSPVNQQAFVFLRAIYLWRAVFGWNHCAGHADILLALWTGTGRQGKHCWWLLSTRKAYKTIFIQMI